MSAPILTDDEIRALDDSTHFHESPDWSIRFARAIEQRVLAAVEADRARRGDTVDLNRELVERVLAEHVQPTIDSYLPDCGDPGCDDCEHILRPALSLQAALAAALAVRDVSAT